MRKSIVVILICVGVLLASYVGYRAYSAGKRTHLLNMARGFLAQSDGKNALLCVQQVLRSDPRNLEATRLMADFTESSRLPTCLMWRNRVVELNPDSLNDRLALAQTAIMMRDGASATNALEGVAAADKNSVAFHSVAGAVAAAGNQTAEAERHFLAASKIEPDNPMPQLNLAVVRLHGTNELELAEARATLERLSSNPTNSGLRCQALRELAMYSLRDHQPEVALKLAKQLLQETNSTFGDRLLQLDVLQQARNAGFKAELAACQREAAAGDQAKIYQLATWQMTRTSPAETLVWLRSLPVKTQTSQPAALLITECYTVIEDWGRLKVWLEPQKWAELEFLRHAFLSRCLRGQNMSDSARVEWEQALRGANGQKQSLVMLLRLVAQWNWLSEGEEVLWTIVNRYPDQQWAVNTLTQALFVGGRTRPLMVLYSQQLKAFPADLNLKNNLAMTALLLDAQELKPHELAREVYQKSPTNSSCISTYAFSLFLQQKNGEALKVIEQLKPKALEDPTISGYYGVILKAAGQRSKAKTYLEWASKAHLLPEERKLFDREKAGI